MGLLNDILSGSRGHEISPKHGLASVIVPALLGILASRAGGGLLGGVAGTVISSVATNVTGGVERRSRPEVVGSSMISEGLGYLQNLFHDAGHGEAAASWIGHGANHTISSDQVRAALGHETLARLAEKTGLSTDELTRELAAMLPELMDKLTPHGRLPNAEEA